MSLYATSDELLYNLEAVTSSEAKRKWKQSIKEHWGHECAYCGETENLTLDHITPRARGGTDRVTNIVCACKECNISKGHQMWSDWYLNQDFFTENRLSKIIEWQKKIADNELYVYRPRRNSTT
jgi:5-methylcytosine-specific restriction endonuclease McrA